MSATQGQAQALHTWTFRVPTSEDAVPQARHTVQNAFIAWGIPPKCELNYTMSVIASEVITNAIRHTHLLTSEVLVTVEVTHEHSVRLGVRDNHPFTPKALTEPVDQTGGRGLLIVRQLVTDSGGSTTIERHSDGKTIWVEMPWTEEC